jgi:hypothetical protein
MSYPTRGGLGAWIMFLVYIIWAGRLGLGLGLDWDGIGYSY